MRNSSLYVFIFSFFISILPFIKSSAQPVSGFVVEKEVNKPIPFATVLILGTTQGTTTDIDGFFSLQIDKYPVDLKIESLGFLDTIIHVQFSQQYQIGLQEEIVTLKEAVILAGENPAIPIIKQAIFYRGKNNPEDNYPFTYNSYSKMVFGPEFGYDTNIYHIPTTPSDSGRVSFAEADRNHYFFITETVTKRKFFPPDYSYEQVLANRFSGLSKPSFTMIASEFQPFSFYKDYVTILGLNYLSPLAKKSYKNYVFELKDTKYHDRDTLFVIQFQPKRGSTFHGLKGMMTINSNRYAIQNIQVAQANPFSNVAIELEQLSEFIDEKQWFPVQFNTHLIFNLDNDKQSTQPGGFNFIDARGKTYITDIKVGARVTKDDFPNIGLDIDPRASEHTTQYWDKKRKMPLTEREKNTYTVIDSLGRKHYFDKKLFIAEAATKGEVPIGPVSAELNKLIDYNNYEGLRLGLGVRTNDKISKYFSVGGYGAYGFQDKEVKYGGDLLLNISNKNHVYAGFKYMNDVQASGGEEFYKEHTFNLRSYSNLYLARMDKLEGFSAFINFRALRDFQNSLSFSSYSQSFNYDYSYSNGSDSVLTTGQSFQRVEIGWSFRFGLREKYMTTLNQTLSLGTRFPYLWFKVAVSDPTLGSTFKYTKLDAKISKTYRIKAIGKLGFLVRAGTTMGNAPSSLLHYGLGMRSGGFNLYIENAFNTMRPNEFLSNTYASLHLHLNLGAIYKTKYSAPEFSVVTAAGWGKLDHPEYHQEIEFETMEKGYYESGIVLDHILVLNTSGIGAGIFYRYGPYSLPNVKDNFGASVTIFYVLQ